MATMTIYIVQIPHLNPVIAMLHTTLTCWYNNETLQIRLKYHKVPWKLPSLIFEDASCQTLAPNYTTQQTWPTNGWKKQLQSLQPKLIRSKNKWTNTAAYIVNCILWYKTKQQYQWCSKKTVCTLQTWFIFHPFSLSWSIDTTSPISYIQRQTSFARSVITIWAEEQKEGIRHNTTTA